MAMLQLAGYGIDYRSRSIRVGTSEDDCKQNMRKGRESLQETTGQDFGYDLAAWHEYLCQDEENGYTRPYVFRGESRAIEQAIDDRDRQRLAKFLSDGSPN
jgi:hypothetical protein